MRFDETLFEVNEQKISKSGRPDFNHKLILPLFFFDTCSKPEEISKNNIKTIRVSRSPVILFDGDDGFEEF